MPCPARRLAARRRTAGRPGRHCPSGHQADASGHTARRCQPVATNASYRPQCRQRNRYAVGPSQFSSAGADAKAGLSGIGSAQAGHGGLADAVSHFVHAWDYSLKKIGENAAAMETR